MYTDPGGLSMLIAAIIGAVIALPSYLFLMRKKIGDWISAKRNKKRSS